LFQSLLTIFVLPKQHPSIFRVLLLLSLLSRGPIGRREKDGGEEKKLEYIGEKGEKRRKKQFEI
jgi:hypothetical protein